MENRSPLPSAVARKMQAAVAAQQRADHAAAESLLQELTREHPGFPDAWHFYGLLLHRRGVDDQALEYLERALSLDPGNFVFLVNSGNALREMGRLERSIECLEHAHALRHDNGPTLVALAHSLLAAYRGGELVSEIERHLARASDNWPLWMLLGRCREQGGDRDGAIAAFAEACRLAPPDQSAPHLLYAEIARKASRYDIVRAEFQTALAIDPRSAGALLGLAQLASHEGDFVQAETLLRKALGLAPHLYEAWDLLSTIHSSTPAQALAEEMDALAERVGDNPTAWLLHFARGRVHERLGDYDAAFQAYELGNRIRIGRGYSRRAQTEYTRDIVRKLDRSFVDRDIAKGLPDPGAIFVCGMHRSGTTLVETILASHPDVSAGGELNYVHDWLQRRLGTSGLGQTGSWLRSASDETLLEAARGWRESLSAAAAGRPRVTDKQPGNYAVLGLVYLCFPTAPIIHVHRDPRDNCFSCFATPFSEGEAPYSSLAIAGHFYRLYESLMAHWRRILGAERIIEVEYEKLVHDPEPEIRRLLAAVGLEWHPDCLDFHRNAREVRTASVYQVRQPLYTRSIGRWQHFERHLGPLLAELEAPPPL